MLLSPAAVLAQILAATRKVWTDVNRVRRYRRPLSRRLDVIRRLTPSVSLGDPCRRRDTRLSFWRGTFVASKNDLPSKQGDNLLCASVTEGFDRRRADTCDNIRYDQYDHLGQCYRSQATIPVKGSLLRNLHDPTAVDALPRSSQPVAYGSCKPHALLPTRDRSP